MSKLEQEKTALSNEEDALLKRNKQAPGFSTSIVRNRSQLLIERYIQVLNYNLQEYIRNQRILKLDIPPEILRTWYPTPNWKKDIDKIPNDNFQSSGSNVEP